MSEVMRAVPDWSFMRSVLEQGASIQQDYYAGRHPTYEHYSARIDEAAREREAQIAAAPAPVDGLVDEVRHALERVRHELYKPARIMFTKDMVLVETQLTAKTADEPLGCGLVAITLNEESAAMVRKAAAHPVDGMVEPCRYELAGAEGDYSAGMEPSFGGDYVQWEDYEKLREAAAALQSRDEGWIAVSERNPKERGEYLVYQPIEGVRTMRYGTSVKWDMGRNKCRPSEDRVSHWMPLPTPPRKP